MAMLAAGVPNVEMHLCGNGRHPGGALPGGIVNVSCVSPCSFLGHFHGLSKGRGVCIPIFTFSDILHFHPVAFEPVLKHFFGISAG
jgi:hypothetical protein